MLSASLIAGDPGEVLVPHETAQCTLLGDVLADRQLSLAGLARLYLHAVTADGLRSSADRNLM